MPRGLAPTTLAAGNPGNCRIEGLPPPCAQKLESAGHNWQYLATHPLGAFAAATLVVAGTGFLEFLAVRGANRVRKAIAVGTIDLPVTIIVDAVVANFIARIWHWTVDGTVDVIFW